EFLLLRKKATNLAINILERFYTIISKEDFFSFNNISILNLIKVRIYSYFIKIFGEIELIKKIIIDEDYDKLIFFNINPDFIEIIPSLVFDINTVEFYNIRLLKFIEKFFDWIFILKFIFNQLNGISNNINDYYKSKKQKILFITQTVNAVRSVAPIVDYFRKSENFLPIYYRYNFRISIHKLFQLSFFLIKFSVLWKKNIPRFERLFTCYNSNIGKIFKDFFRIILVFELHKIYCNYLDFLNFIRFCTPNVACVTSYYGPSPKLIVELCRKNQIPTVYIPHSAITEFEGLKTKTDFSFITVPGEADKIIFLKHGIDDSKIKVTGRPRYEIFYTGKVRKLKSIKDEYNGHIYNFDPNKFTILLTTNPVDPDIDFLRIQCILKILNELGLLKNLIIKLHPKDNEKYYIKIIKEYKIKPIIVKNYNILQLIKSCDLLISLISTTILESMIIGTPIIVLDYFNFDFNFIHNYLFMNDSCLFKLKNPQELKEHILILTKNKSYRDKYSLTLKNCSKKYSFFDPKQPPTQMIINLIINIIQN
ncbi:MAG: hypothetical protein ACTSVV_11720, partial [Promethearchaeota archaeon]